MRNFHSLWKCSYNCIRRFVGKVVHQKSLVRMIRAPGCISSVICLKILHCLPLLHWLLQHVFSQQRVFRQFSKCHIDGDGSGNAGITFSWWSDSALCKISLQWDLIFLVSSKIKCFNSSERKNFPSFYSLICLADCCVWMQITWRFFSIFGIFGGLGCWGRSFTSISTQFAQPLHCPDPEAGMIVKGLYGEPIQKMVKGRFKMKQQT